MRIFSLSRAVVSATASILLLLLVFTLPSLKLPIVQHGCDDDNNDDDDDDDDDITDDPKGGEDVERPHEVRTGKY